MRDGPNISAVAALLGDRARADVLTALMADRALTATELASVAGITKQTMSAHLARLVDAKLVVAERQGRHRYFRLADEDVAALLESLMGVAFRTGAVRLLASPREPALRHARVCYDHLAGEIGVRLFESLVARRAFAPSTDGLELTTSGREWFRGAGIDPEIEARKRRTFCRACLDWSERRQHLGGALGAAVLTRMLALGWVRRERGSRVLAFVGSGRASFRRWLDTSVARSARAVG